MQSPTFFLPEEASLAQIYHSFISLHLSTISAVQKHFGLPFSESLKTNNNRVTNHQKCGLLTCEESCTSSLQQLNCSSRSCLVVLWHRLSQEHHVAGVPSRSELQQVPRDRAVAMKLRQQSCPFSPDSRPRIGSWPASDLRASSAWRSTSLQNRLHSFLLSKDVKFISLHPPKEV